MLDTENIEMSCLYVFKVIITSVNIRRPNQTEAATRVFYEGLHFPAFGLNTKYLSVFSPNAGKYGPEITLFLDTFHALQNRYI